MTKDEALDKAQGYLDGLIRGLNMDDTSEAVQVRDAIKQARALDKKAENARELGLDYEPADGTQVSKVWWDGEKLMAKPIPFVEFYKPVQEPVAWREFDGEGGYDYYTYEHNENLRDKYIERNGEKYASWVEPLYTTPPAQQAPVQPVPAAMKTVVEAMQADPDYAWGWHCNIAMAFVDAGGDHYTGNQGAARFMKMLADVEPAHELPPPPAAQRQRVVFPTMLCKMWSGGEVQKWLDETVNKENA